MRRSRRLFNFFIEETHIKASTAIYLGKERNLCTSFINFHSVIINNDREESKISVCAKIIKIGLI